MARLTIQEIYNGKKYNIYKDAMEEYISKGRPCQISERTWIDMLIVKHTLIVAEKMKKEGDSTSVMFDDESSSYYVKWDQDNVN